MADPSPSFTCVLTGEQSLLIQCAELLLARGHSIQAVVAADRRIEEWCAIQAIPLLPDFTEVSPGFDYLFSITNLRMLPAAVIELPRRMSINFHDGPLPRYAGLNAPVWALLAGEKEYGVTWHQMEGGVDTGPILVSRRFSITSDESAFTLNARCYEEGLAAFEELVGGLERKDLVAQPQDLTLRTYYGASARPAGAGVLDWRLPAAELHRVVRALDFGPYPNPVLLPKVELPDRILLVRQAEVVDGDQALSSGAIQSVSAEALTVRCGDDALRILRLTDSNGNALDPTTTLSLAGLRTGDLLPLPDSIRTADIDRLVATLSRHENFWRRRLAVAQPLGTPFSGARTGSVSQEWAKIDIRPALPPETLIALVALLFGRLSNRTAFTLAYIPAAIAGQPEWFRRLFATVVPFPVTFHREEPFEAFRARIETDALESEKKLSFLKDLPARDPRVRDVDCTTFPIRIVRAEPNRGTSRIAAEGAALTVVIPADGETAGFLSDGRMDPSALAQIIDSFAVLAGEIAKGPHRSLGAMELLGEEAREHVRHFSVAPDETAAVADSACVHELFERQAALTPDRVACVFREQQLTYRELNEAANRLAHHLRASGVARGDLVGVMVERSLEMIIALYAVQKAGAAYVPLDPSYPSERLAHMIDDGGLRTVILNRTFETAVGSASAIVVEDLATTTSRLPAHNVDGVVDPSDLAYVIYTSGSTGKPKGVMVEHRNVVNFFSGMDQRIGTMPGVWLAVTSISFDISVLELFWTLVRGFTVIVHSEVAARRGPVRSIAEARPIDFGFFYWNVARGDGENDGQKYRLLLEGARFADTHGFNAVWNPERHFESFGGLFPNPSVTCAALATITNNVALRAGSCVVPLHSPIRIAEEWAVVDNLSNGRVGISIAAGWAPPDFAIRPENFRNAKQVMFESAETVRRLWRGETVLFPGPEGEVRVRTLPRPVQKELPLWVTTAGNIETFIQAGAAGMNLLTHLLGQTLEDVATKVRAYRKARADAGHDGPGVVTLMLHTFVGPDADEVERIVRDPLKNYLQSALFLVKAAAWQFPTFRRLSEEQGKTLDEFFRDIAPTDMDELLEFAFQRYFRLSGLFGTPASCMEIVDRVKSADVDEIACLIDFGVATDVVLDHLPYLDVLRAAAQQPASTEAVAEEIDSSVPALLRRHDVTHFQCTPSMAAMLVGDPVARPALSELRHMLVGGEAFPRELAQSLRQSVRGRVTNMYGPTETTIWSSTEEVVDAATLPEGAVPIGRPLPNQRIYIMDEWQGLLPVGATGEIVIGGAGVARGYWKRAEQTAQRFVADPFATDGSRMYRTGDLGRYLPDGRIEYMGRLDDQVKIRGYRVELGEIEAALRRQPDVAEAVVVLREDVTGDQRLVAYVRSTPGAVADFETWRRSLRRLLPEFMVPSGYVMMDSLPRTPNGKIDRKSLPPPQAILPASASMPPGNDAEAMIAEIWQRALGVPTVSTRANFFDIGGHSLLVVQVLKELRERVAKPLHMTDLFKHTTVESLARFISDGVSAPQVDRGRRRADARRAAMERRRQQ
jgi:natural product biosynthesis luciferase-like monooxygenase protein